MIQRFFSTGWKVPAVHATKAKPGDCGSTPSRVAGVLHRFKTSDEFLAQVNVFYDRIQSGMVPMKESNPIVEVEKEGEAVLRISTTKDRMESFVITANVDTQRLMLQSPISGVRYYEYAVEKNKWIDETDAHDFEGLLTRDLMRLSIGMPQF